MQHVRILVLDYHGYVALRFDVLVCSLGMLVFLWSVLRSGFQTKIMKIMRLEGVSVLYLFMSCSGLISFVVDFISSCTIVKGHI